MITVFGASGFIGKELVRFLHEKGIKFISLQGIKKKPGSCLVILY